MNTYLHHLLQHTVRSARKAATILVAMLVMSWTSTALYAGEITISIDGDLISTDINQAQLGMILDELATHMPLTVKIGDVEASQVVSSHINNVSLGQLLTQILKGKSYLLTVDKGSSTLDGNPSQNPSRLVVFPAETSAGGSSYDDSQADYSNVDPAYDYQEPAEVYDDQAYEEPVYDDPAYDDGSSDVVDPSYEE